MKSRHINKANGFFSFKRTPLKYACNEIRVVRRTWRTQVDKPHKQVVTTYPVAIRFGQARVHVQNPIPWHAQSEGVQCSKCEVIFIVTDGFPKAQLIAELEKHHKDNKTHPDVIPSDPTWTTITECDCGL